MDVRFFTRNVELSDELQEYMESKMSKLEKFFSKLLNSQVVVSLGRGRYGVEVTANANGVIMRGEERDSDIRRAFDKALKNLERQIKRHKDYLTDRAQLKTHDISFNIEGLMGEIEKPSAEDEKIVKMKKFAVRAMSPTEATMQMDLLGHKFFLFKNMDTGDLNVVYKREQGGYGLLQPVE